MRTGKKLCCLAAALCLSAAVRAQCAAAQAPTGKEWEAARIERLAAAGTLWGAVKYFHPQLAYQDIDWDQALLRTLPAIEAARSPAEYCVAVNSMLATLNDADTAVTLASAADAPAGQPAAPTLVWNSERVATLAIPDRRFFTASRSTWGLLDKLVAEAKTAHAVIIDLRGSGIETAPLGGYWFSSAFLQSLPQLFSGRVATAAVRYRRHSGFITQMGSTSGDYHSGFFTRSGDILTGLGSADERKPLTFLIDASASDLHAVLSGLQLAGLARIVYVGNKPISGGPTASLDLPGLKARIRVGEIVNADGSLGLQPDLTLSSLSSAAPAAALEQATAESSARKIRNPAPAAVVREENFYGETPFPDRGHRLLALFRLWSTMEYFFPYKSLMDRPWNERLPEYVPRFEAASNAREYGLTVAEMASHLQDSHVTVSSPALREYFGTHTPEVEVKLIGGRTAIVAVWGTAAKEAPSLRPGDIVMAVDDEETAARRARLARYLPHSTPQGLAYKVNHAFLTGAPQSQARIRIKNGSGGISSITLTRNVAAVAHFTAPRTTPVYRVLPQGYGYFDLTRLTAEDLDAAFAAVWHTPALILDMRGYPRGIFYALAPRFARHPAVAAIFERPQPGGMEFPDVPRDKFTQTIEPAGPAYAGKVVMLIDGEAVSQSEHTCLFMQAARDVTFVGSPTIGANGDITYVGLPGAVFVRFTGQEIRHADGRQLQRVGIQPNIKAEPTLAGIRAGRDEVLERAIASLRSPIPTTITKRKRE